MNRLGQSDPTPLQHELDTYKARVESFGFHGIIVDGHDVEVSNWIIIIIISSSSSSTNKFFLFRLWPEHLKRLLPPRESPPASSPRHTRAVTFPALRTRRTGMARPLVTRARPLSGTSGDSCR